MSAKDNLYLLKKMRVIKLTIGYHTIYDKCKCGLLIVIGHYYNKMKKVKFRKLASKLF